MIVDVYLHSGKSRTAGHNVYSVRNEKGKVLGHISRLFLRNGRFIVSEKGRARVLRERRKNVHAIVRGELVADQAHTAPVNLASMTEVWYDPYKTAQFRLRPTDVMIHRATSVLFLESGVYVEGVL